jgi:Flp pilus assembly protein TadB
MADTEICAVANHSIGQQWFYRPKSVYRPNPPSGILFVLVALVVCVMLSATGVLWSAPSIVVAAAIMAPWLILIRYLNTGVQRHNSELDQKLNDLISGGYTESMAKGCEVKPPPLPN